MAVVEVACPVCGKGLTVPRESVGKKGRCPACGAVFPISPAIDHPVEPVPAVDVPSEQALDGQADASEDDVLDWLSEAEGKAVRQHATAGGTALAVGPDPSARPPRRPKTVKKASDKKRFPLRLGHVDEMGAFLLFDPNCLYDEDFRSAFQQRCVVCGKRRGLSIHLVMWSSKLPGRGEFGAHTSYSRSVFDLDKLGGATGGDLLAALDRVENLPEPYCLPFPYYLCGDCSPVGAIVPDVRFAADGHSQECELGIFSLKRAEEFVRAVCGPDCPALEQLAEARRQDHDDPWLALPLAVRSRLKQWFKPKEGERFVTYISDCDFAKTEAGMAGVVLTNKRLVYRKFAAHVEIPLTERMTIESEAKGSRPQLRISSMGGKPVLLSADQAAAERLRTSLRRQGARARWT